MISTDDVRSACVAFGRNEIGLDEAVERLRPAYLAAARERAERDPADPDAASTPTPWTTVDVARWTGEITPEQYAAIADAITGGR